MFVYSLMMFVCVEAAGDMNVCYILDGVLILYGIILTVLYCRLRVRPIKNELSFHAGIIVLFKNITDTYETIKMDKKPIM
uniref:Fc receptor, IgE, high affinity I, gamma polypeptide like n=1 Tax=Xiphophorus couchianus TaxID=32473 RepID=A0A3B5MZM0_9TELE